MQARVYLQWFRSNHDVNGNPRRVFALYGANGDILDIFDEGYSGKPVVVLKDRKIQLVYSGDIDSHAVIPYAYNRDKIQYRDSKGVTWVVVDLPTIDIPISQYNEIMKAWRKP